MIKSKSGFTIVELLIVIVVIAILAAITVVAYNGVQTRAKHSQLITGVNAYHKAILSYQAENGSIPNPGGWGCLGANYPSDQCWVGTSGTWSTNATLDTLLSKYVPSKPTLTTSLPAMNSSNNRGGLIYLYNHPSAGQAELRFYIDGNNKACGVSGFSASNEGALTQCIKQFS